MLPTFSRLMLKRFNTFFDRLFNQLLSRANNLKQDANAKGAFVQSLKPCEWENGFSLFSKSSTFSDKKLETWSPFFTLLSRLEDCRPSSWWWSCSRRRRFCASEIVWNFFYFHWGKKINFRPFDEVAPWYIWPKQFV